MENTSKSQQIDYEALKLFIDGSGLSQKDIMKALVDRMVSFASVCQAGCEGGCNQSCSPGCNSGSGGSILDPRINPDPTNELSQQVKALQDQISKKK